MQIQSSKTAQKVRETTPAHVPEEKPEQEEPGEARRGKERPGEARRGQERLGVARTKRSTLQGQSGDIGTMVRCHIGGHLRGQRSDKP